MTQIPKMPRNTQVGISLDTILDPTVPGDWSGPSLPFDKELDGWLRLTDGAVGEHIAIGLGPGYGALLSEDLYKRIQDTASKDAVRVVSKWNTPVWPSMTERGPLTHSIIERVIIEIIVVVDSQQALMGVRMEACVTSTRITRLQGSGSVDLWIGVTPPGPNLDYHRWRVHDYGATRVYGVKLDEHAGGRVMLLKSPEGDSG